MENRYGLVESMQLTVLVEDYAGYDSNLLAQHGISFLLEAKYEKGKKTILFDTGQSAQPVLHNMKMLGKDPDQISGSWVPSPQAFSLSGGRLAAFALSGSAPAASKCYASKSDREKSEWDMNINVS